ncbi:hypothetical protein [Candidatus Binatus sp.]|uniref:hypothetical protein n=1 Tax=Candidatus Binatus sp. TaxID=2811406 RepID=UPI002F93A2FF
MATNRLIATVDGLAGEVFAAADHTRRRRLPAFPTARNEITRREYGHSLRSCFNRAEVREIIREVRKAEPRLNQEPIRYGSMSELCERASSMSACLGADFRIAKLSWPSGLALWGFYLSRGPGLKKRPLICVNAAHHRTAAAMAFGHEVGHHVTARLFGMGAHPPLPSLYTGFESHLDDPLELAADITVSLAMYPRNTALKFFREIERETKQTAGHRLGSATRAAADDFWRQTGLDRARLSTEQKVQYQAGSIHFTRLRQALLDQYGI